MTKADAAHRCGAHIVFYDRLTHDREAIARDLSESRGLSLIPPYDHADVIAGQATVTRELIEAVGSQDAVFASQCGGGLLGGATLVTAALAPARKVYRAEPVTGNLGRRAMLAGRIVHITVTICNTRVSGSPAPSVLFSRVTPK